MKTTAAEAKGEILEETKAATRDASKTSPTRIAVVVASDPPKCRTATSRAASKDRASAKAVDRREAGARRVVHRVAIAAVRKAIAAVHHPEGHREEIQAAHPATVNQHIWPNE